MNIYAIIIGLAIALLLIGLIIGYLLGWRSGHLTGIEYAMKIWLSGSKPISGNTDILEYTADTIKDKNKRLLSVKEETHQQIEEMRQRGIK